MSLNIYKEVNKRIQNLLANEMILVKEKIRKKKKKIENDHS